MSKRGEEHADGDLAKDDNKSDRQKTYAEQYGEREKRMEEYYRKWNDEINY